MANKRKDFKASCELMADDWFDLASALWNGDKFTDPEKAIEYLDKAIELAPGFAEVYSNRGVAFAALGLYQRAIEDFNEVIRLEPDDAKGYYNRGVTYSDLGQNERAIEDYNEAIRLDPDDDSYYHNRGVAYYHLAQYQPAIEDFNEVIRLNPDHAKGYKGRGIAYLESGNKIMGSRDALKAAALGDSGLLELAQKMGDYCD